MFWRIRLPLILTFCVGLVPIVTFFLTEKVPGVSFVRDKVEQYMVIIAGFALLLGVVNVTQSNIRKIEKRKPGWPFAVSLLAGLFVMGAVGILSAVRTGPFQGLLTTPQGAVTPFYWMTRSFFSPLQAAMFSLLAFYIASAAFRAFRVRSLEAGLLAAAALLVMLGRVPIGAALWDGLPAISDWIMNIPNNAAKRAILIGAALGAIATGLKVILGLERNYLGGE
jgi:hypothetical protein